MNRGMWRRLLAGGQQVCAARDARDVTEYVRVTPRHDPALMLRRA